MSFASLGILSPEQGVKQWGFFGILPNGLIFAWQFSGQSK
jgi:hypothetical protein